MKKVKFDVEDEIREDELAVTKDTLNEFAMKNEALKEEIHTLNGKIMALVDELDEVTEQRDLVVADRDRLSKAKEDLNERVIAHLETIKDLRGKLDYYVGFRDAIKTVFG